MNQNNLTKEQLNQFELTLSECKQKIDGILEEYNCRLITDTYSGIYVLHIDSQLELLYND